MIFSKACEYGIRGVIYLARETENKFVSIRDIAQSLGIPFHFLTKVFQMLTEKGIIESSKGAKGGVRLAIPAESVTIFMVVAAIDGTEVFSKCILGFDICGEENPCPLHSEWKSLRQEIREMLEQNTLTDFQNVSSSTHLHLVNLSK